MSSLYYLKHDRRLLIISVIDLVAGIGQGCTLPIFPIYVRSYGVSYLIVGLVISGAGIIRLLVDVPVGFVLNRSCRKPFLRLSIFLLGVSTLFPIFAIGIWPLFLFQVIQGLGMGILMVSVLTVTSDISPLKGKGSYVGCLFAFDSLSVALGAFVGGKLVEVGNFQSPFIAMLLLSIAAALIVEIFYHETLLANVKTGRFGKIDFRMPHLSRNLAGALLAAAVVSILISGAANTAIPLYGSSLLMSPVEIGFALTTLWAATVLVQPLSGGLCDKVGMKLLYIGGFVFSSMALVFFFFSKTFYMLEIASACLGLSIGIATSSSATMMIESSRVNSRGLLTSFYRIFRDLGSVLGPVMVGVFSDMLGGPFAFLFAAVVCTATALFGLTLQSKTRTLMP